MQCILYSSKTIGSATSCSTISSCESLSLSISSSHRLILVSKTSQPSIRTPLARHLRRKSTIGRTWVIRTQPRSSSTCRFGVDVRMSGIDAFERLRQLLRLSRSILGPRWDATDQIPRSETAHPARPRVSTSVNLI